MPQSSFHHPLSSGQPEQASLSSDNNVHTTTDIHSCTPEPVKSTGCSSPLPVKHFGTSNYTCLASSEIQKEGLSAPNIVVYLNSKLLIRGKASTLAVKLAREAFFGEDVLKKCTVSGERGFPGLPLQELQDLKNFLFKQFAVTPMEFESVWKSCCTSIGQACKRLREKKMCAPVQPGVEPHVFV